MKVVVFSLNSLSLLAALLWMPTAGCGGIFDNSSPGKADSTIGVPKGVTASAGNGQVTISWTAVTGATSYNVYYRTAAGVTTKNGIKVAGATSGAAITSLTNGTTYYFVVTAVNAGGESAVSSEVSATPKAAASSAATGAHYDGMLYDTDTYE